MNNIKLFEQYFNSDDNDYQFAYSCVHPESEDELDAIIEELDTNDVRKEDFLRVIPFEDIQEVLPVYESEEQFLNDWHVKCFVGSFWYDDDEDFNKEMAEDEGEVYKIKDHGEIIQFAVIVHSAIEYVWKK